MKQNDNLQMGGPNASQKIIKLRNGLPLDIYSKPNVNFEVD